MPRHKQRTEHYITKSYEVFAELRDVPVETGQNMLTRFLSRVFIHGPRRADLANQLQGIYALAQVHATLAVADAIADAAKAGLPASTVTAAATAEKPAAAAADSAVTEPIRLPDAARPPLDRAEMPATPQQVVIVSGDNFGDDPNLTAVFERAVRGYDSEVAVVPMMEAARA